MAASFVSEAFQLIEELNKEEPFHSRIAAGSKEIYAGLHIFAGRRLIDAGDPAGALRHFRQAWRLSPGAAARYWYKIVQAVGGTMGLGGLFLAYRGLRRRTVHQAQRLVVENDRTAWVQG